MKACFECPIGIKVRDTYWSRKLKAFDKKCLKREIKFPTSVMVRWYKVAQGPNRLRTVSTKVNSEVYQQTLEHFLISSSEILILCDDDFVFQKDSVSFHTYKSTTKWLQEMEINVLPRPSNSLNLNPIENLWEI